MFESVIVVGFFYGVQGLLKNLTQVTIATMLLKEYLPFWDDRTASCEEPFEKGGVPHSERVSSLTATAMFYFLAPFIVHMLLNTFVWGLAPTSTSKVKAPSTRAMVLARPVPESYRAKSADALNYFKILGKTFTGADAALWCSPLRWLSLAPNDGTRVDDLVLHDAKFWQLPTLWWQHFKTENGNSSFRAFFAYLRAMFWKVKLLIKLTFGVWSESQIEQFQIRYRAACMSFSAEILEEHEAMIRAVGRQQSTVWLFFPAFGPTLSRFGDYFNMTPLFVYDNTSKRAVAVAEDEYEVFLRNEEGVDRAEIDAWRLEKAVENAPPEKTEDNSSDHRSYKRYGALPMEWMRIQSELRPGGIAYENFRTKEVSEIHPRDPAYLKRKKKEKEEEKRRSQKVAKQSEVPLVTTEGSEVSYKDYGPLPPGWTRVPSRSRPGQVSYEHRGLAGQWIVSHRHPLDPVYLERERESKNMKNPPPTLDNRKNHPSPTVRSNAAEPGRVLEGSSLYSGKSLTRCALDLPLGWVARPSRSRPGERSYKNERTGEVIHMHPADIPKWKEEQAKKNQTNRTVTFRTEVTNAAGSSSFERHMVDAPPGWIARPSRSRPGETSYKNTETGEVINMHPHDPVFVEWKMKMEQGKKEEQRSFQKDEEVRHVEKAGGLDGGVLVDTGGTWGRSLKGRPAHQTDRSIIMSSGSTVGTVGRRAHQTETEIMRRDGTVATEASAHSAISGTVKSRSMLSRKGKVTPLMSPLGLQDPTSKPAEDSKSRNMSIGDWIESVRPGNQRRFAATFKAYSVSNLRQLIELDEYQFTILKRRIKVDRQKDNCEKMRQLIEAMTEVRQSSSAFQVEPEHVNELEKDIIEDDRDDFDDDVERIAGVLALTEGGEKGENRGIYALQFDAREKQERPLSLQVERIYWIVEIKRPEGQQHVNRGAGMLVWFSKDSVVGLAGHVADDSTFVRFLEYRKDASEIGNSQHGQIIPDHRAYYMYEFDHLSKPIQYGSKYSGIAGRNLPSRDDPLFIPCSPGETEEETYFTCAMCLEVPHGTSPTFTLYACYVEDTPLFGMKADLHRKMSWFFYVSSILSTTAIVFATGTVQRVAIYLYLLSVIAIAIIEAQDQYVSNKFIASKSASFAISCFLTKWPFSSLAPNRSSTGILMVARGDMLSILLRTDIRVPF